MVSSLLDMLKTQGVELRAEGDKLKWEASEGVMTDSLIAQMKTHKPELLALLGDKHADAYHQIWSSTAFEKEKFEDIFYQKMRTKSCCWTLSYAVIAWRR